MWRMIVPRARHLAALAVFLLLFLVLLYFAIRYSDRYGAAEQFILSDARVTESVGSVTRAKFEFWDGFHMSGGEANFTFKVTGTKGVFTTKVQLRRSSGRWRVMAADIRSANGATSRIVLSDP